MVEVGEKVYIDGSYGGAGSIGVVEKITPTGRIVVGGLQYRPPSEIGDDDWCALRTGDGFSRGAIRKLTPLRVENVQKARIRKRINEMRNTFSVPSDASLEELKALSEAWDVIVGIVKR